MEHNINLNKRLSNAVIAIISVAPLIIVPKSYDYFYFPKILFVYTVLAYMLIVWFLYGRNNKPYIKVDLSEKLIGIYLLLVMISVLFSPDIKTSLWGGELRDEGLFAITAYVLLYLFSKRYYKFSEKHIRFYLLTTAIVSLYGIVQYFGFDPIPRDFIRLNWSGRAFSTIGNPNFLGTYLVLALPISMFSYIYSKKTIYMLITLLNYLCLLCTNSRGPWLGFIFSIIVMIYYIHKLKYSKKCLILILCLMLFITLLFNIYNDNAFLARFLTIFGDAGKLIEQAPDANDAGTGRIFIWSRVIELIKENPVWGVGLETLDIAFTKKFESDIIDYYGVAMIVDKAHNEYLHIAVSTGVLSLIAYLAFLAVVLIKGFGQIKNHHLVLPLFCSVTGHLVQAFFNISVVSVAPIFWIFIGILYKLSKEAEKNCKLCC